MCEIDSQQFDQTCKFVQYMIFQICILCPARKATCTCVYCLQSSLYTSSHLYLILVVCFSYQVFLKKHSLSLNTISPHGLTMVSQSMPHPFLPFTVESKKNAVRQDLWWFTAGTCTYNVGIQGWIQRKLKKGSKLSAREAHGKNFANWYSFIH